MTRSNALESLVISGWVRGLSDRDIEAALAEVLCPEAALSRSTVSRICQRIKEEFQAWRTRDLSGIRLALHGVHEVAGHFQRPPARLGRLRLMEMGAAKDIDLPPLGFLPDLG